jgi:hypothetical protein
MRSRDGIDATRHAVGLIVLHFSPPGLMAIDDDEREGEVQKEHEGDEGIRGDEEVTGQETLAEPVAEPGVSGDKAQQPEKKKREKKEPVVLVRESGKSLLPFARVQKIIKADKVCIVKVPSSSG